MTGGLVDPRRHCSHWQTSGQWSPSPSSETHLMQCVAHDVSGRIHEPPFHVSSASRSVVNEEEGAGPGGKGLA
jgi:hypothetical protein